MITWNKECSFLDQVKAVYTGEREGIYFRIVKNTIHYCYICVDSRRDIIATIYGIGNAKKWCEDFEYCYDCGKHPVHADKLCRDCYFK